MYKGLPGQVGTGSFSSTEPLVTVDKLKSRYLFGIPLQDELGNPLDDEVLQHGIDAAVSYLEHKLDIVILERTFTERYDYRMTDYIAFNFISMKKRPILEVDSIKAKFPNGSTLVSYPEEWYVVEKEAGQVQLSPTEGAFPGSLALSYSSSYSPLLHGSRDYWPQLFEITYRAGFCADEIPAIINEMIGMMASLNTFDIMGDVLMGAGVVSESVSMDGVSVSKQLSSSAMYNTFSARVTSYQNKLKDYMDAVKKYYNAIPITIV